MQFPNDPELQGIPWNCTEFLLIPSECNCRNSLKELDELLMTDDAYECDSLMTRNCTEFLLIPSECNCRNSLKELDELLMSDDAYECNSLITRNCKEFEGIWRN